MMLRPMTEDDLPLVLEWRNHPEIRRVMVNRDEITPEEHRAWWARQGRDRYIYEADGRPVGFMQIHDGEWGFYIAPDEQGKGYGRAMCEEALATHKVVRATLRLNNLRSYILHAKLGFIAGIIDHDSGTQAFWNDGKPRTGGVLRS